MKGLDGETVRLFLVLSSGVVGWWITRSTERRKLQEQGRQSDKQRDHDRQLAVDDRVYEYRRTVYLEALSSLREMYSWTHDWPLDDEEADRRLGVCGWVAPPALAARLQACAPKATTSSFDTATASFTNWCTKFR